MPLRVALTTESLDLKLGGVCSALIQLSLELGNTTDLQFYVGNVRDSRKSVNRPILNIFNPLAIWKSRPDVIHANGLWHYSHLASFLYAKLLRVPLILSPHGMLEPWSLKQSRIKKRLFLPLERYLINRATVVLATSEQEAKSVRAISNRARLFVLPNFVCDFFSGSRAPRPIRRLLFVSRIHKKKGLHYLLEALRSLPENIRLDVVGGGDPSYFSAIERLARGLGISSRTTFLGHRSNHDLADFYASADLFVLPTHSENFGNVILEALSTGLPVIITRNVPWQDVEDKECGLICDVDPVSIFQCIITLSKLGDADLQKMQYNARKYYLENQSNLRTRYIDFYKSIVI